MKRNELLQWDSLSGESNARRTGMLCSVKRIGTAERDVTTGGGRRSVKVTVSSGGTGTWASEKNGKRHGGV
jgi:hypothetical protein